MKKLFTSLALGLAAVSLAWGDCPYDITWTSGSSYSTSSHIDNMTVPSLSTVWGTFPDGTTIVVGQNKPVTMTGPENFTRTSNLGQAVKYNPVTETAENLPAIKIVFKDAPLSINVPGVYTASVPAGSFTINGVDNVAFDVSFNIEDTRVFTPIDLDCHATPAPGQYTKLNNFNVDIVNKDANDKVLYVQKGVKYGAKGTISKDGGEVKEYDIITRSTSTGTLRYGLKLPEGTEFYEDGVYTVTYPQGAFMLESNNSSNLYTNKTLEYVYTISGGSYEMPDIVPAPGTVTALASIELGVPDDKDYLFSLADGAKFTVTLPNGTQKEYAASLSQNKMYINLISNEIEYAAGEYTVNIPKNSFNFVGSNAVPTNGFNLKYNVTGGTIGDLEYSISDGQGEITDNTLNTYKLEYFYVKFDKPVTPTAKIMSKVVYPDGSVKYVSTSWSDANQRFMIFMNYPKEKGQYEITFPAAAACADGVFNNEIKLSVNFLDYTLEDLACTSTPKNGSTVTELLNLSVSLDPDQYTSASPYLGGITKTYFSNDDDQEKPQMQYLSTSGDPLMLSITLNTKVTEIGDYTWSIPENSILAVKKDGTQVLNKPINFFWSVRAEGSVAESFGDEVTEFNVYDLNGVSVLKNGTREQLNSLGKGIYIINGKTYIIR